jgi:hypothetical protein
MDSVLAVVVGIAGLAAAGVFFYLFMIVNDAAQAFQQAAQ